MKNLKTSGLGILIIAALIISACSTPKQTTSDSPLVTGTVEQPERMATNIILLIGDGMGLPQITAGMYMNGNRTALEECTVTGIHKAHSADNLITDSAAGATAFACGFKTLNGAVAVDHEGQPYQTIVEEAEEKGMATGLIVTSTIVHATPASFAAHNMFRWNYEEIAADMADAGVELLIGGGFKFFARRTDERNLLETMKGDGYTIGTYIDQGIDDINFPSRGKFFLITADDQPLPVSAGRDYFLPATEKGLAFLSRVGKKEGFFLMIESSQIDWGGHANDEEFVIQEFLEFDKVIQTCIDFAKKDGNTLVIVTADHETGGLTLNPEDDKNYNKIEFEFSTGGHTAAMIPVFAFGPGAELFTGLYDNTDIYYKMRRALGFPEKVTTTTD